MFDPDDSWTRGEQTETWNRAMTLFQRGYELQRQGLWADAITHYRHSLRVHPSAEAHTFLGWVLSFLRLYEEAIEECKKAIAIDPGYGNPYNDIGAYLVELGRSEEAISWFETAIHAARYDARCFPCYNLGRVYERKGDWLQAIAYYRRALRENPTYDQARRAWQRLQGRLN